ncbi:MAG TPA: hypothetical protein VEX86_21455, partial [Longimicrobium sp.]|nr:hypothetical protein [Longimicrobium sp.]
SATRSITVNGVELDRGSYGYAGSATSATSVLTVRLAAGANVVRARINDVEGNAGAAVQVTYTYTPPPDTPVEPSRGSEVHRPECHCDSEQ